MKKYTYLFVVMLISMVSASAQTQINKSIAIQSGQKISFVFDYPEMVRITTWDKSEIAIQGTVSINDGENDNAFELQTNTSGNTVVVKNIIRDFKNLPQRITVVRDGKKMVFHDKEALKKYQSENGKTFESQSRGVDFEIILEIKVPRNVETTVQSTYGMVEVKDFTGPLTAISTYGGVDASVKEKLMGELVAETNFGQIYSNLDVKFIGENSKDEHFHTLVSAKPGTGPRYAFESKYGNVYLRKSP
ncbi:hypothetical protein [Pseudochryseolinea flava]|uniref:Adhesin domain-containing protein n=1 Tax=Pseudochryseolinea flava TaxID=2059302 RepID=A0A364XU38_9BACT|nr:hypothetical protein [Pseudochryseolinea flava]RAV97769.1 hypothetical protein DQQ10_26725 [Pseudochryseolinea flava]